MFTTLMEVTPPTVSLPADWFSGLVSVATSNAPAILTGFLAIFGVGFGLTLLIAWIKRGAKAGTK